MSRTWPALVVGCAVLAQTPPKQPNVYEGVLDSIRIRRDTTCGFAPHAETEETKPGAAALNIDYTLNCQGTSVRMVIDLTQQVFTARAQELSYYEIQFDSGVRNSVGASAEFAHPAAKLATLSIEFPARDLDPSSGFPVSAGTCSEPFTSDTRVRGSTSLSVSVPDCARNRLQSFSKASDGSYWFQTWVEVHAQIFSEAANNADSSSVGFEATLFYKLKPAEKPDLSVKSIEVVQVVQSEDNAIPLVAGKEAVARVFFNIADKPIQPVAGVTGILRGWRGSTELPGSPLTPFNKEVTGLNVMSREETGHSLNFLLPREWWESAGEVTLEAEMNPAHSIDEQDRYKNNKKSVSVTFNESEPMVVGYLQICTVSGVCPSPDINGMISGLRRLYPVAAERVYYYPTGITWNLLPDPPQRFDKVALKGQLRTRYNFTESVGGFAPDQLVGFIPYLTTSTIFGTSDPIWGGADMEGRVVLVMDSSSVPVQKQPGAAGDTVVDPADPEMTLAHELAHNFGLRHPNQADGCGARDNSSDWPYTTAKTDEIGFDSRLMQVQSKSKWDVMSYCSPPASNIWMSAYSYKKLLRSKFQPQALSAASKSRAAAAAEYVVVSGWAGADGLSGQLESAYRVTSQTPGVPSSATGGHFLRFFGETGATVDYCFALEFAEHRTGDALERASFSVKAPWPTGTIRVALMKGETELAALSGAKATLALSILAPQPGDKWAGRKTLTWMPGEAQGWRFTVLYSADGQKSWNPLSTDITETQLGMDTAELEAGAEVYFRVLASRGLDNGAATVGPVEVVASPRLVTHPAEVKLDATAVGAMSSKELTIANRGSKALTVTAIDSDAKVFVPAVVLPFEVPARKLVKIPVTFQPAAVGEVRGAVTVKSDDTERPEWTVPVLGTGLGPRIEAAAELAFGDVNTGQSKSLTLTVSNTGTAEGTVKSLAVSSALFSASGAAAPFKMAAGATQDLTVKFSPATAGAQSGTLTITSDDPVTPSLAVKLSGKGVTPVNAPVIEVVPAALDFGTLRTGQTRDLSLLVRNTGSAALRVDGATMSNTAYQLTPAFVAFTVAVGGSQTLTVRFAPSSAGAVSGTLRITSNDVSSPAVTVALSGTGETPPPGSSTISLSTRSLGFGGLLIGKTKDLTFSVSGAGAAVALVLDSFSIDNPQYKIVSPSVPLSLAFSGAVTVTVRFTPTLAGAANATLSINSNAGNEPAAKISLSGISVATGATELKVDDGVFEQQITASETASGLGYYLNRITPSAYPATLKTVRIYFKAAAGWPVNVVWAAKTPTDANIDGIRLSQVRGTVKSTEQFVDYDVTPLTIESGDFVIGFSLNLQRGTLPMAVDTSEPLAARSYTSTDGAKFAAVATGNFGIRAVVVLGGQ